MLASSGSIQIQAVVEMLRNEWGIVESLYGFFAKLYVLYLYTYFFIYIYKRKISVRMEVYMCRHRLSYLLI